MPASLKSTGVFVGLAFIAIVLMTDGARGVSAEVVKKCNALTAKEFPPRVIGNPAAGSAKGTGADQRAYYNKCVANGGQMPDLER